MPVTLFYFKTFKKLINLKRTKTYNCFADILYGKIVIILVIELLQFYWNMC